jgi:Domain of unknown function DUF29
LARWPEIGYLRVVPDSLYERDVLAWSQHQADLLRRLGRGERVNDVDWANVAEEIEDAGLSELHSVESFLDLIIVHLLKVHDSPDSLATTHWRREVVAFQKNARRRFTPSMRQRIDVEKLYREAVEEARAGIEDSPAPHAWPDANPFTLDDLLAGDHGMLLARLGAETP